MPSDRHPDRSIIVIGAASCAGAPDPGCAAGPDALHHYEVFRETPLQRVAWDAILRVPRMPPQAAIIAVSALNRKLAEKVQRVLDDGNFPLVVGGDHSCAIGTWSGAQRALAGHGALGLIWIDAHMDSHTFATTPSGQLHGMPLASLLGRGHAALRALGEPLPDLRPGDLCLIGVRSYEAGEAVLLHQLGVRVYTMDEVRSRGLAAVFDEALARVRAHTAGFGVSVDLDALDPDEEPGVGSPVPGGIRCAELAAALSRLRGDPDFIAMEIVEYNPYRDRDRATAAAAGAFVEAVTPLDPKPPTD
jgi:arginase